MLSAILNGSTSMYRTQVSLSPPAKPSILRNVAQMLTLRFSFAWMEIVKTLATLFKLFDVERTNKAPTVIREGFFNKAAECHVLLTQRP